MNSFKKLAGKGLALVAFLAAGVSAFAHPGHGLLEKGPRHAFTSPDHLLVMGVAGILLVGFGLISKNKTVRRAMVGAGSLAMGLAAAVWMVG
jgi:hydrogenase/urease accessory protein HupE